MTDTVKVTDSSFGDNVLANDKPVLVDFWATWCLFLSSYGPVVVPGNRNFGQSTAPAVA